MSISETLKPFACIFLIITLLSCCFCSCSEERKTVDIKYRRAAALHSERTEWGIERICEDDFEILSLYAAQAFVYDVTERKYVYISGADKILYPASVTKLLTALYSLELLSPDELITPGDELLLKNEKSSIAFIKKHHKLSVEMLIEALLLPSGGDAAFVLAAAGGYKIGGREIGAEKAVELFLGGMNEYAKEKIGMCGSNFTSPDGFYDPANYSTVEDMTLLSIAASQNELIMKYASLPEANVTYASGHTNTWKNTNRMLHKESEYYSPYVTGLKTGTLEGNSCLVCTFSLGEREYIAGVFSEKSEELRYVDMTAIIEFCEALQS